MHALFTYKVTAKTEKKLYPSSSNDISIFCKIQIIRKTNN